MKVCEIIHGRTATVELGRSDGGRFPENLVPKAEVFILYGDGTDLRLQISEDVWSITGASARDKDNLRQLATRSLPQLCWLVQAVPGKGPAERLLVQIHEFPSSFKWNEPIDLGVDDKIVDDMRTRRRRLVSAESVIQWLTETIFLHPRSVGQDPRALLSGSPAPDSKHKTAFRLYGAGFAVDVERGADERLHVGRVVEARRSVEGDERRPIYLATGQLRFCDATTSGLFRGVAQTELDNLVAQADSYFGLWREYNKRERQTILRRARQFGWFTYARAEQRPDGLWRFHLEGDNIAAYAQRLDGLDGEQLQAGIEVPTVIQSSDSDEQWKGPRKPFVGAVVGRQHMPPSLDLRPPGDQEDRIPPKRGFLFGALGGDEIRIARRQAAWDRIRTCTNPMPQLGLIIEGQPVPERRSGWLKPITKAVREVFPNPNDRQRLALEIALNTPDIALIQGPPGTGKTRVIAALQARLSDKDEGAEPNGLSGNTLLTSFQHDAVENAAAATLVMGLPAIKIGFRHGAEEIRDGVEIWRTSTAQKVRAARAQIGEESSVHTALQFLRNLAVTYIQSHSNRDEPATVLRSALDAASPWLPTALAAELADLQSSLSRSTVRHFGAEDGAFVLQAVRALRTDAVSFADDGPACAYKVLRRLDGFQGIHLTPEERTILEQARDWTSTSVDEEILISLRSVRDSLIDRLGCKADVGPGRRAHADVEDMLVRVVDALTVRARESVSGVDSAVESWLLALESDPNGIREAIKHYSMVLAATCQQSVSKAMEDARLGEDTVFRTVIVDEAARSNPLDMLIPMALAERRIVLVGDHRQLPHILEPEIERELEQSVQEETREQLRRSLFYKLFAELREREKKDGVKRTVTLNVQYRMHPALCEFVSQQFYERYGEGFTSGRAAEEFAHTVTLADGTPLAGSVAAWIDVPVERGLESRSRSKNRPIEARRVALETRAVIEQHPNLSVGVITFYSAQRDEILACMAEVDLTEANDAGGFRVRDRWQRTIDGRERLRIGTVDAFQGKEFDVVFLSLVRSNKVQVKDEITRRRRYGFLLLENRLCVAMSRQHRLLVVVGDPGMAVGPDADASVPGLVAFRNLCEGTHGKVVR
jgi:hypothetical protein